MDERDDGSDGESPCVWRYGHATKAHVVVDGEPYFDLIRDAMLQARQRVMLIGWDFDTRITLGPGRRWWQRRSKKEPPAKLGSFILWLARQKPGLEVLVLRWNIGALKSVARGSMMIDLLRWRRQPGIRFKLDSAHPLGCSHHQKVVVIDDRFAVCGGIDMTTERWDTREHLAHDIRRRFPGGKPSRPWHDCTMMVEGEVAEHLGAYGRQRWHQAGAGELAPCRPQPDTAWPRRLEPQFRDVEVGIARTRSQHSDWSEVREIEALYLALIARARRFIYAENQYFASRKIFEAIVRRLAEPSPPEFVVINPLTAYGWLDQAAMDTARVRLLHELKARDPAGRFSIWTPFAAGDVPIYVHAKLMIVDDEVLRVGSANMNNRSLGLDSECDVFIDCARPANHHCGPTITALRHDLLAEHCALAPVDVGPLLEQHGSMAAMIASRPSGDRHLKPLPLRELRAAEKSLADNEVLDPERPEDMLAFYRRGGLFRGLRRRWSARRDARRTSRKESP